MIEAKNIVTLSRIYADAHGISLKTVSSRVFSDQKKIAAIENGKDITIGRFNDALLWFSEKWPEGVDWPQGIPRPVVEVM